MRERKSTKKLPGADERRNAIRNRRREEIDKSDEKKSGISVMDFGDLNIKFYKPKESSSKNNYKPNKIDILSYTIATDKHPDVGFGFEIGHSDYKLEYHVHRGRGVNNDKDLLCLARTYKKPCPICEEKSKLEWETDEETIRDLTPQKRDIYNIKDLNDEEGEGFCIWDVSWHSFENEIDEVIKIVRAQTGELLTPDNWEDGRIISFIGELKKFTPKKGNKSVEYVQGKNFEFEERDYVYPDPASGEMDDKILSLDKYLIVPTYEEVYRIHFGKDLSSEEETEVKPVKSGQSLRKEHKIDTSPKKEEKNKCKFNHKFGDDFEKKDECCDDSEDGCPNELYGDCEEENKK